MTVTLVKTETEKSCQNCRLWSLINRNPLCSSCGGWDFKNWQPADPPANVPDLALARVRAECVRLAGKKKSLKLYEILSIIDREAAK